MSNDNLDALHTTALSPACQMPVDPADQASRTLAAVDTATNIQLLLNSISSRLCEDSATAADALVIEVARSGIDHIIELIKPRQPAIPG